MRSSTEQCHQWNNVPNGTMSPMEQGIDRLRRRLPLTVRNLSLTVYGKTPTAAGNRRGIHGTNLASQAVQ